MFFKVKKWIIINKIKGYENSFHALKRKFVTKNISEVDSTSEEKNVSYIHIIICTFTDFFIFNMNL